MKCEALSISQNSEICIEKQTKKSKKKTCHITSKRKIIAMTESYLVIKPGILPSLL